MLSKEEKAIIRAVEAGGSVCRDNFGRNLKIYQKTSNKDYYTKADILAEEEILRIINKAFPTSNIMTEETGFIDRRSSTTVIIDPLDSTSNFTLGIPYFSTAIGLAREGETIFSAVYSPILKDLYIAQKGKGARKNGKKMKVSKRSRIEEANISFVSGYSNTKELRFSFIKRIRESNPRRILDNWCPTLDHCLLASGQVDCIISNDDDAQEPSIEKLFVYEAGGVIADFAGKQKVGDQEKKFIAANNIKLLKKILAYI